MEEEIQNIWNAIKGLNDDVRELQKQVARLKIQVGDARATIESLRNNADLRAPMPMVRG